MSAIAVIGLGNFGTALARNWTVHGKAVRGWTVEAEVFASIDGTGVNEKYLPGIELPGLKATLDLGEAVEGAAILALALPSHVRAQRGSISCWNGCGTAKSWLTWPRASPRTMSWCPKPSPPSWPPPGSAIRWR